MPSPRQTQSFLIQRFEEAGIRPATRHGQDFLIDLNLLDLIVETAELGPDDVVLEVGTGLGSLTARMADMAAAVVTVEIDPRLFQLAAEQLGERPNVVMLSQDALRNKNHIHDAVLEAVRHEMAIRPGSRFKLVANLPYNVATPILSNLVAADPAPVSLTATIQKELAERIVASPGTKDYSALSIWLQAQCDISIVRTMPPQAFWPRPKVQSAIVHLVPSPEKRARIADLEFFHHFVRSLFLHRRKFLRGVLIGMLQDQLDKSAVDELLAGLQFGEGTRAEQLPVESHIALSDAVRKRSGSASMGIGGGEATDGAG
jgi:16S rRNA (adenine1518-N6/adenine1519-N6)-dimethyltransferase